MQMLAGVLLLLFCALLYNWSYHHKWSFTKKPWERKQTMSIASWSAVWNAVCDRCRMAWQQPARLAASFGLLGICVDITSFANSSDGVFGPMEVNGRKDFRF